MILFCAKLQNPLKKPRKSYPVDYKLKVLDYSRGKFNREVAEHFKIDEKNVRRWKKNEQQLRELDKKNQTFNEIRIVPELKFG